MPTDSVKRTFEISLANQEWLQALAYQRKRSFSEVLNSELEYLRTFGIPAHFAYRLSYAARAEGSTLRAAVQTIVFDLVSKLPKYTGPIRATPPPNERKRVSAIVNGPNETFIERTLFQEGVEWSAALQRSLDFARTFGLPPEPLARLEHHAAARGVTGRDLIAEQLIVEAMKLPDPPPEPGVPSSSTRRRRKA